MQAASAAGVPLRTAERVADGVSHPGAAGLRRAGRADKGRHRLPDELLEVIEGMALRRPPPHAAEVYRASVKIAAEQGWFAVVHRRPGGHRRFGPRVAGPGAEERVRPHQSFPAEPEHPPIGVTAASE